MSKRWLLNADVGEGCDDSLIMPYLDCANICCGAHAGGAEAMHETLALAKKYAVMAGAHPGYPDREHFGRLSLALTPEALEATLRAQILALTHAAAAQEVPVRYVKPHGALNHDMLQKEDVFTAICKVTAEINPDFAVMVPTNARHEVQSKIAAQYGLTIWWEVFADRAYEPSGLLRPRKYADAVHHEPAEIINQLEQIENSATITAIDGSLISVDAAKTICVHGDNPTSVEAIRQWSTARK